MSSPPWFTRDIRDGGGEFYPLVERAADWTETGPDKFLDRLRRDLLLHVLGHIDDDAAMIAIEPHQIR
ncbi:hypothetical protein ACFVTY_09335 [Streptomyces sp. NPDC058067]|uniref:hypothetical protein n=1 Tax=Streptomyces sp. NPDC058067 TaxID=3346324 RepID=UPI0036F0BDBD